MRYYAAHSDVVLLELGCVNSVRHARYRIENLLSDKNVSSSLLLALSLVPAAREQLPFPCASILSKSGWVSREVDPVVSFDEIRTVGGHQARKPRVVTETKTDGDNDTGSPRISEST